MYFMIEVLIKLGITIVMLNIVKSMFIFDQVASCNIEDDDDESV